MGSGKQVIVACFCFSEDLRRNDDDNDDDDNWFNNTSTHVGHLYQNDILIWFSFEMAVINIKNFVEVYVTSAHSKM